jgi:hypothetical protein
MRSSVRETAIRTTKGNEVLKSRTSRFVVSLVLLFASVYFLWAFLTELLAMIASIIVAGLWYAGLWAGINLLVLTIAYGVLSAWKDRRHIGAVIGRAAAFFLDEAPFSERSQASRGSRALTDCDIGPRTIGPVRPQRYGEKTLSAEPCHHR